VNKFIEERESEPYVSVEEFVERLQIPVNIEGLSVGTRYFRTHGQVVQGEQTLNMTSLVYRDDKGKTLVINRTLGQF
jgi:type II secretory pathway component PulK